MVACVIGASVAPSYESLGVARSAVRSIYVPFSVGYWGSVRISTRQNLSCASPVEMQRPQLERD